GPAFRDEVKSAAIEIDFCVPGQPVIAAVVKQESVCDSGCRLGRRPDVEGGSGHRGNTKPFGNQVAFPHDHDLPGSAVELGLGLFDQMQTLRIHTSVVAYLIVVSKAAT